MAMRTRKKDDNEREKRLRELIFILAMMRNQ